MGLLVSLHQMYEPVMMLVFIWRFITLHPCSERDNNAEDEIATKRWFTLIGMAYVHDIMDGEAIRKVVAQGRCTRTFQLR